MIEYIPLLEIQRNLMQTPRGPERFQQYLRVLGPTDHDVDLLPLTMFNPMAKDHITAILDHLLRINADQLARQVITETSASIQHELQAHRMALVVVDDLHGGWTNRYDYEFRLRFQPQQPSRSSVNWLTGVIWSSDIVSAEAVCEAIRLPILRAAYIHEHGPAITLRDMLRQEGTILRITQTKMPELCDDEVCRIHAIIEPFYEATDMRTCIECLFGDPASSTLGFTPRTLPQNAGLNFAQLELYNRLAIT